ncbi:MAG: HD domain-containing phosphohydrolase [Bdellovibrionota bacterium]
MKNAADPRLLGYTELPVERLHVNQRLPFEVFVYMPSEGKVLLFLEPNLVLEHSKYKQMQASPRRFLIKESDINKLKAYLATPEHTLIESLNTAFDRPHKVDAMLKRELQLKSAEVVFRSLQFTPDPSSSFDAIEQFDQHLHYVVDELLALLDVDTSLADKMQAIQKMLETDHWNHSLNVAAFAPLFAIALGYSNRKVLHDISTAGYLHDVGIVYCNVSLPKRELNYTPSELRRYHDHPEAGRALIANSGISVSEEVKRIIAQHEERFDGSGFPLKISGVEIYEPAQIVAIADRVDQLVRTDEPGYLTVDQALLSLYKEALKKPQRCPYNPALLKQIVGAGVAAGIIRQ